MSNWHRNAVAVTGPTGSGKSTVSGVFRKLGALVLEADVFAREALRPNSPCIEEIRRHFGGAVFTPVGEVDRKALAKIVFSDLEKRQVLESIVHPQVRALAARRYAEAAGERYPLVVYDCPLLFETDLYQAGFKKTLLVTAPVALARARAMKRDGITAEEFAARLGAQRSIEEKKRLADIIIDNSGTREELEEKVRALFEALRRPS
jgi:dephospho-CoA kinase